MQSSLSIRILKLLRENMAKIKKIMQSIRFGILDTETCNNQEASQNSVKFNLTEGSVKAV